MEEKHPFLAKCAGEGMLIDGKVRNNITRYFKLDGKEKIIPLTLKERLKALKRCVPK